MMNGVHHVQLSAPANCEERLREFYANILGMWEIAKPERLARRGGVWFRAESVELHLGIEANFRPATKAHPGLLVRDIVAYAARLQEAGVVLQWDDALPGYRRFYCADPCGNRLEFLEPDDRGLEADS